MPGTGDDFLYFGIDSANLSMFFVRVGNDPRRGADDRGAWMQLKRAEGLAWRKLGDEAVVIDLKRRMMYGLNAAAFELWEALEEGLDIRKTSESREVSAFIDDLLAEGLASGGQVSGTEKASESAGGPRLLWKEEVRQFAGGCGFQAGQGGICDSTPMNS